ncbi:MAG: MliC family protein [Rhodospirillales bacterium]|nr:MliC family protein [Rhodospirillales bacterium]
MRRCIPMLAVLLAAGCMAGGPVNPVAVSEHRCDNGAVLRVVWGPEKADITYGEQRWTLPIAVSGSGARYTDGVREVWEHQGVVRVTDGASAPASCR